MLRKRKILKNKRRPFPYFDFFVPVLIKKDKPFSIVKQFMFTDSAIYHFDDADQWDVNKLFGFSIGLHHHNSFRFGWRPNKDLTKMEIVGYEYHDKVRVPTLPICNVELNKWYKYVIDYIPETNEVEYVVLDGEFWCEGRISKINLKHKINWGYRLGLYFGGNKKAPHNITIYSK